MGTWDPLCVPSHNPVFMKMLLADAVKVTVLLLPPGDVTPTTVGTPSTVPFPWPGAGGSVGSSGAGGIGVGLAPQFVGLSKPSSKSSSLGRPPQSTRTSAVLSAASSELLPDPPRMSSRPSSPSR